MNYEIIGTMASAVVLLSFLVNKENKIRMVNIVGAALFVVYGLFIHAFSVWAMNAALIVVHGYYLTKGAKGSGKE